MIRWYRRVSVLVLLLVLVGGSLRAQDPQGEFQPVKPGELQTENIPAAPLIFAAYATVWILLLLYVFVLWRKIQRVERELADVNSKLGVRRS
jgi:CcmD family protein